ncbi:MAG: OmpA family protein [Cyclobacteriaceae bacterium]|nr:OmpA family protein [Cyclobacteriaceae bacterium HetDA_MAG_MS6]
MSAGTFPLKISCLLSCFVLFGTLAKAQDSYVEVSGKVLSREDSSAVSATVNYEKLPHYDDLGMFNSSTDGDYGFTLAQGTKYYFIVEKEGFQRYAEEITAANEGSGKMVWDIYLRPVEKEKEEELITLDNLNFARGSDRIEAGSFAALDDFVTYLKERSTVNIQLEGHTDFAGNADANMRLSQARVDAVAEYLSKKGIRKARISTKAFGGTQPLSTDRTDEAKARNRRVEVRLFRN